MRTSGGCSEEDEIPWVDFISSVLAKDVSVLVTGGEIKERLPERG